MPIWSPPGGSAGVGTTTVTSSITNVVTGSVSSSISNVITGSVSSSVTNITNTYTTGFATASLMLSMATLSGGMQLAAATGTLPQRLTMATPQFITASNADNAGVVMDPDNLHFWTSQFGSGRIRKFRLSDGALVYTASGSTTDPTRSQMSSSVRALTVNRAVSNRMWFACSNGGQIGFLDPTGAAPYVCEIFGVSGTNAAPEAAFEHVAGKVFFGNNNGSQWEFAYGGTGSANYAVYTGERTPNDIYARTADMSGNMYTCGTGANVRKFAAPFLTASATISTIGSAYVSTPGYGNTWRNLAYHPQANKLYIRQNGNTYDSSEWFAVNLSTFAVEERVFGPIEFGNPLAGVFGRDSMAFTTDGTLVVWPTHDKNPTSATTTTNMQVLRLNPQQARWTWTPTADSVITNICFAGMMNNDRGFLPYPASNAWFQSERDKRWTKFYYSFDGGTSRYEFQNASVLAVNVSSTGTLTIDCEMQVKFNNMNGTFPYIGCSMADMAGRIIYRTV